jgi:hypothetical protein
MSPILSELLSEIDAFLAVHAISESTFGVESVGDKNLIRELRKGRDLQASTIDRVRQFIESEQSRKTANG